MAKQKFFDWKPFEHILQEPSLIIGELIELIVTVSCSERIFSTPHSKSFKCEATQKADDSIKTNRIISMSFVLSGKVN